MTGCLGVSEPESNSGDLGGGFSGAVPTTQITPVPKPDNVTSGPGSQAAGGVLSKSTSLRMRARANPLKQSQGISTSSHFQLRVKLSQGTHDTL